MGRPSQAQGDHVFQAHQSTQNDRTVRPRAGARSDKAVAVRLHRPVAGFVCNGCDDAVTDVVGVPLELAVRRGVLGIASPVRR